MAPHPRSLSQVRLRQTILVTGAVLLTTAFGLSQSVQGPTPKRHPAAPPHPTTPLRPTAARPHPTTRAWFAATDGHPASSPTTSRPPPRPPRVGIRVPPWTTLATLHGPVPGYSVPAAVGPARIVAPTWGAAVTLPVTARRTHWLEVRVIGRPNGQTAWVPAADVSLTRTPYYIVIDLSRRHLLLFREGRLRLYAPAGVGAPETPTPLGRYFVGFFTRSPSPGYGPFVIVTSGLASTVTDWEEEGTPVITLHGPLDSAALITTCGAALSQGSVLLRDDDLQRLRPVPAGTPIDVMPTVTPGRRSTSTGDCGNGSVPSTSVAPGPPTGAAGPGSSKPVLGDTHARIRVCNRRSGICTFSPLSRPDAPEEGPDG